MKRRGVLELEIVHEGRGGHVDVDGARYPIEHLEEGRFSIAFPAGNRRDLRAHLDRLVRLVAEQPGRWTIENRSKRAATSPAPARPSHAS